MERDENDLDGDGSHPQKHAKSPELAREFLLDAAVVIFKEQVIYCQKLKPYPKQYLDNDPDCTKKKKKYTFSYKFWIMSTNIGVLTVYSTLQVWFQ